MIDVIYVIGIPVWLIVLPIWLANDDKIKQSGALAIAILSIVGSVLWPFTMTLGMMTYWANRLLGE